MIKKNKWKLITGSLLILLPILAGLVMWNILPEQMPMHWDIHGQVDRWGSKAMVVLFLPLFLLAIHWMCVLVTSADPRNRNQSQKAFGMVLWICPMVSLLVGAVMYASALGMALSVDKLMLIFMGLLFIILGNYLPKCKQNYTIGIKVVWALDNEENWNATHRFAAKLWVGGGILIVLLAFLPWAELVFGISLALIIIMALASVLYSYLYYKKHQGKE